MSLDGYIEDSAGKFNWAVPDEEAHKVSDDITGATSDIVKARGIMAAAAAPGFSGIVTGQEGRAYLMMPVAGWTASRQQTPGQSAAFASSWFAERHCYPSSSGLAVGQSPALIRKLAEQPR
jgi:hypothetical protein